MKLGTEEKPIGRSVQNMHENKEEKIDRQGQRRHLDMSSQTLVSSVNSSVGWWEMWALGGATIYETKLSFCAWKESDRQVFGPVTACDVNSTDLTAHCAAVWLCSKTCVVLQSGGLSGIKYIRHVAHLWKEQRSVPPSISLKTKTNKKKKTHPVSSSPNADCLQLLSVLCLSSLCPDPLSFDFLCVNVVQIDVRRGHATKTQFLRGEGNLICSDSEKTTPTNTLWWVNVFKMKTSSGLAGWTFLTL